MKRIAIFGNGEWLAAVVEMLNRIPNVETVVNPNLKSEEKPLRILFDDCIDQSPQAVITKEPERWQSKRKTPWRKRR